MTARLPKDLEDWLNNGTTYIIGLSKRFNPNRKIRKLEIEIHRASRFSDELPLDKFTKKCNHYYALQNRYMQMTGHYLKVEKDLSS